MKITAAQSETPGTTRQLQHGVLMPDGKVIWSPEVGPTAITVPGLSFSVDVMLYSNKVDAYQRIIQYDIDGATEAYRARLVALALEPDESHVLTAVHREIIVIVDDYEETTR